MMLVLLLRGTKRTIKYSVSLSLFFDLAQMLMYF